MLLLSTIYLLLKTWRFIILLKPLSDIAWSVVARGYIAGQAVTLLPGGVAARAGILHQVGVPVAKSSVPIAMSSILDQFAFITGSVIAALWFEAARMPALIIMAILAVLAVIIWIPVTRRWLMSAADWLAGKFKFQDQWHDFLESVQTVLTWRIIGGTLAITAVAFALKIVTLDLAMRGAGITIPYPSLFLAYILPTMLGRLSALPGGVGVTEAGMVGFLASSFQLDPDTTTAAVSIFRIATILYEALLGAVVYFFAWRGEDEVSAVNEEEVPTQTFTSEVS
jgi:uncharacterized protein (TIRG00374 family)